MSQCVYLNDKEATAFTSASTRLAALHGARMVHLKHKLLEWKSAWAKRRRNKKAFPSPRGKSYYFLVGGRKLKPLYRKAEEGDVVAQTALASSLLFGTHGRHDTRESLTWNAKALAAGSPHAKFLYGCRHFGGFNVVADWDLAVRLWKEAAEEGDPQACAYMAWAYHFGLGVKASPSEVFKWQAEAARRGMPSVQYLVGVHYARGDTVERDLVKSYFWLSLADRCNRRDVRGKNRNEFWRFEPNPWAPSFGNARGQARKIRSRLGHDAAVAVEKAVKQWNPREGYPAALENRA